jgi:hypothetical protein
VCVCVRVHRQGRRRDWRVGVCCGGEHSFSTPHDTPALPYCLPYVPPPQVFLDAIESVNLLVNFNGSVVHTLSLLLSLSAHMPAPSPRVSVCLLFVCCSSVVRLLFVCCSSVVRLLFVCCLSVVRLLFVRCFHAGVPGRDRVHQPARKLQRLAPTPSPRV